MKILFIGNSYQYASNVAWEFGSDGSFVGLAEAAGKPIDWHGNYIGGASLTQHWADNDPNNPRDQLANGDYDLVVINGNGSGNDPDRAADFADLAKANGTAVMFFDPWAPDNEISVAGGDTIGGIHKTYEKMATDNGGAYSPNGRAFADAHAALSERYGNGDNGETAEKLMTYDNIHPTPLAGYLAGLVMYGTIYGTKPPAPSVYRPDGISLADAQLMYDIAWKSVQDHAIFVDGAGDPGPDPDPEPEPGSISGRMFLDVDKNGSDGSEAGLNGVTVYLWQDGVGIVATTTTDADGSYSFDDIDVGNYKVRFADPGATMSFTTGNLGSDAADSDVGNIIAGGIGETGSIAVTDGKDVLNVDAGATVDPVDGGGDGGGDPGPVTVDPDDYDLVLTGSKTGDTLRGSGEDDHISGYRGNDLVSGGAGDDFVDGNAGADTLVGGLGDDIIAFDLLDGRINGGAGVDRLMFTAHTATDAADVSIFSVEVFDLVNAFNDDITFSYRQMRQAKDGELMIQADAGDAVHIDSEYEAVFLSSFTEDGQTYDRYQIGSAAWGATFSIDADVALTIGDTLF